MDFNLLPKTVAKLRRILLPNLGERVMISNKSERKNATNLHGDTTTALALRSSSLISDI